MTHESPLEQLPNEVKDLVLDHLFAPTSFDYPGAHRAELRVYTGHVILRRISPIPPPRFQGCRALMKTCKAMCRSVLEYMYSRLEFDVIIYGSSRDPGQRFNQLTSEYPIGATTTSMPLRHIRNLRILLSAWSEEDVGRLQIRLAHFLDAIKYNTGMKIRFIGFYTKPSISSSGSADSVAKMLEKLKSRIPTQVYSQDHSLSDEGMQHLLTAIGSSNATPGS